jgi:hypothetical protein
MPEPALERVAAACPKSVYKDDRHSWCLLTYEPREYSGSHHAIRQCSSCKLTILILDHSNGLYDAAPEKQDVVLFAYYANGG